MFARNLANFILEITNENGFTMDWKNEIFAGTCVTLDGEITKNGGPHNYGHIGHDLHFHPRHLHRRGGDQPRADGAAHAADVRRQRHSRHRAHRRRHRAWEWRETATLLCALGFIAVILGTLNVVGGFVVTDRMLEMFKAKPSTKDSEDK